MAYPEKVRANGYRIIRTEKPLSNDPPIEGVSIEYPPDQGVEGKNIFNSVVKTALRDEQNPGFDPVHQAVFVRDAP